MKIEGLTDLPTPSSLDGVLTVLECSARIVGQASELADEVSIVATYTNHLQDCFTGADASLDPCVPRPDLAPLSHHLDYLRRKLLRLQYEYEWRTQQWLRLAWTQFKAHADELQAATGHDLADIEAAIGWPVYHGNLPGRVRR